MIDSDLPGYDDWKLAAPDQDAPPLDAECEICGFEDYKDNLIDDLCLDCDQKIEDEDNVDHCTMQCYIETQTMESKMKYENSKTSDAIAFIIGSLAIAYGLMSIGGM
tara:strand:- start:6293 stop:6613 length:321 start_codon:yes stop_codon:yes gene_type:complete